MCLLTGVSTKVSYRKSRKSGLSLVLGILSTACLQPAWGQEQVYLSCVVTQPYAHSGTEFDFVIDLTNRRLLSDQKRRVGKVTITDREVSWESKNASGRNTTTINRSTGRFLISSEFGFLFRGTCEKISGEAELALH